MNGNIRQLTLLTLLEHLPSKRGVGTRDEALLTILCPLLKKLDYCTLWAYLFSVSISYLKVPIN